MRRLSFLVYFVAKKLSANMVVWLTAVVEECQRSGPRAHLRFAYSPPPQLLHVEYDVNKSQQVINNLISNSIKFAPDGGTITIGLAREGSKAHLKVANAGIGIPGELQPLLFDKFTKAWPARRANYRAGHVGYSHAGALHHGHVWVDSQQAAHAAPSSCRPYPPSQRLIAAASTAGSSARKNARAAGPSPFLG